MSSLDDFFAKKDRRRSATKTNLLAADELYRTLEETTKAAHELDTSEKHQPEPINTSVHQTLEFGIRFSDETIDEEDEWCDFTEEHDQPFPNLRRNSKLLLSSVVVAAAAASEADVKQPTENAQYPDTGGDGLGVGPPNEELNRSSCPWLKVEPSELNSSALDAVELKPQSQSQSPLPSPSASQSQLANNKAQPNIVAKKPVYVPPALRQSQSEFSVCPRNKQQPPAAASKLAKGQAPDLNNVDFFPSLCQSRISKRAK